MWNVKLMLETVNSEVSYTYVYIAPVSVCRVMFRPDFFYHLLPEQKIQSVDFKAL